MLHHRRPHRRPPRRVEARTSRTSRSTSRANFHEKVITPFVQSYLSGLTPSPCVLCNTHVKFDLFHQKARAIGAEKIATGHYARITRDATAASSCARRCDLAKDQSYFLFELTQEQLAEALFPLGELTKPEVRDDRREGRARPSRGRRSRTRSASCRRPTATRRSSSARRASRRARARARSSTSTATSSARTTATTTSRSASGAGSTSAARASGCTSST